MSPKTAPPGSLLVRYILAEHPEQPLTFGELQTEVEHVTGDRLAKGTLWDILERLQERDDLATEFVQTQGGELRTAYSLDHQ